jgi:hypothetical protein
MDNNGANNVHTWVVVVQGAYIFKNLVFKKSYLVLAWKK